MAPATRAYLPLERSQLSDLHSGGVISAGAVAFCVTDAIRCRHQDLDEEECEFIALQQAASYAVGADISVIIAAVDLPESTGGSTSERPEVTTADVPAREVVSFHLSDDALNGSTEAGTPENEAAGEQADLELSWFDITELSQLLRR